MLFAIAIGCKKQDLYKTTTFTKAAYGEAVSHEEAIGKGIALALVAWPYSDGYGDYWCQAFEIPMDFIKELVAKESA